MDFDGLKGSLTWFVDGSQDALSGKIILLGFDTDAEADNAITQLNIVFKTYDAEVRLGSVTFLVCPRRGVNRRERGR
eukprot:1583048-Rhodomonas_salina.1